MMKLFSKITVTREEKCRRRAIYAVTAVLLSAMFLYGFVTVYVNSYNIMNREPMVVFSFSKTEQGFLVVILNKEFGVSA
ncbi:MAG: hypothetical protein FWG90_10510 [Oscillospiraceae bacterium]|nr:hypothetical protein [Oscillospiraceae bacterium]